MTTSLSAKQKIGQMFFIGLPGETLDPVADALIREIQPAGICLFARNCKNPVDIRSLLDDIRERSEHPVFLGLDQEGGLVDRLRRVVEPMPSAADVSAARSLELIERFASLTARVVGLLGFNMNFAPVLDVIDEERAGNTNGALLSRAFGRSAEDVVEFAGHYSATLYANGIMPCLKHFPGIGGIEVDSHDELPEVSLDRNDLFSKDLIPYMELLPQASAHAVMTGHTVFPRFDLQEKDPQGRLLPTSLSPSIVTGLLREELNFQGLALTDDLEMGAIVRHYGMAEAAKLAVKAGNDLLLICNDPSMIYEGFNGVLRALETGEITETRLDESVARIQAAGEYLQAPPDFDADSLAELSQEIVQLKQDIK